MSAVEMSREELQQVIEERVRAELGMSLAEFEQAFEDGRIDADRSRRRWGHDRAAKRTACPARSDRHAEVYFGVECYGRAASRTTNTLGGSPFGG